MQTVGLRFGMGDFVAGNYCIARPDNPDHGINCACMDKYIGQLRHLFKVDDLRMQQRVDNVVRLALER